jgi:Rieske Fe-S protein
MTSVSRRQALGGAAAVGVGGPLVAACGPLGGSDTPKLATGEVLVKAADVPVGGGVVLTDAHVIVTQPKAGRFEAFTMTCTHAGCGVSAIQGTLMVCPCHGSEFSIADGSVVRGPATRPLPRIAIKQANGAIEKA